MRMKTRPENASADQHSQVKTNMTVSTGAYLQQSFAQIKTLGDKAVSSDAMFVVDGYEQIRLLTKQFPQPTLSSGGEIAIATPMGGETWQAQQAKANQQGQISFYETVNGDVETFLTSILAAGGRFDATIYEGTMEQYKRGWKITDCFIQLDNPDRDWENRSQVVMLNGTLFFHYTGDRLVGNF